MNETLIRRHLSGVRAEILDIIHDRCAATRDELILSWSKQHPSVADARGKRAPRVIDQLLWQLQNLEWIARADDHFVLTRLGQQARDFARVHRGGPCHRRPIDCRL